MREDEISVDRFVEVRVLGEVAPQNLLNGVLLLDPLYIERLEHLVFFDESPATLPVGFHSSPPAVAASNLAAPVFRFVDPYAGRAGDNKICVEVLGYQEASYGDVLLGQMARKVRDKSNFTLVAVASRRQGGPGAVHR